MASMSCCYFKCKKNNLLVASHLWITGIVLVRSLRCNTHIIAFIMKNMTVELISRKKLLGIILLVVFNIVVQLSCQSNRHIWVWCSTYAPIPTREQLWQTYIEKMETIALNTVLLWSRIKTDSINHSRGCGVSAAAENLTKTPVRKQKISAISAGEIYIWERETKAETWHGGVNKEAAASS